MTRPGRSPLVDRMRPTAAWVIMSTRAGVSFRFSAPQAKVNRSTALWTV
jgi:hypothetical protein